MKLRDIENYTEITRKSIESVKCTRIITEEGSEKYNKYIQNLARRVLKESATRTDGHKHDEVGILARLDGTFVSEPIYGYWDEKLLTSVIDINNENYIKAIDSNLGRTDIIFVHNHPNNSILSYSDIANLLYTFSIRAVIAVGNNGDINYALKTSRDNKYYWNLYQLIYKRIRSGSISTEMAYSKLLTEQKKYNLDIWRIS